MKIHPMGHTFNDILLNALLEVYLPLGPMLQHSPVKPKPTL